MRFLPALLALVAACAADAPTLPVEASGYTTLEGRTFRYAMRTGEGEVAARGEATIRGGAFRVEVARPEAGPLRLDGFFDVDGDGLCRAGRDLVMAVPITAEVEAIELDPGRFLGAWEGCQSFGAGDLRIEYDDLPAHAPLAVAQIEPGGRVVERRDTDTGTGDGQLTLEGTMLPDTQYVVALWVDTDFDGVCDVTRDRALLRPTGALGTGARGVGVIFTPVDEQDAGACAHFRP